MTIVRVPKQVSDEDLFVPQLRNPIPRISEALHGSDFYLGMARIEIFDCKQFAGKFVVRPIDVADHVVDVTGHAG